MNMRRYPACFSLFATPEKFLNRISDITRPIGPSLG